LAQKQKSSSSIFADEKKETDDGFPVAESNLCEPNPVGHRIQTVARLKRFYFVLTISLRSTIVFQDLEMLEESGWILLHPMRLMSEPRSKSIKELKL
jgi:hypothetical protein